jgi:hypothetical protein
VVVVVVVLLTPNWAPVLIGEEEVEVDATVPQNLLVGLVFTVAMAPLQIQVTLAQCQVVVVVVRVSLLPAAMAAAAFALFTSGDNHELRNHQLHWPCR